MELKEILAKHIEATKLDSVIEEVNAELPKLFIPKNRFNEVNEELKLIKSDIEQKNKLIEDLSKKSNSIEEYEKKVAELQKLNSDIEENSKKQIASLTKKSQLKELLLTNNAHKDALELLVDKYADITEVDGDKIKDAENLIKKIKEERSGLFIEKIENSDDKGGNKKTPAEEETARLRKLFGLQ